MLNRFIVLLLSFYTLQATASSEFEKAKALETAVGSKFHSSKFEFGGDKTKDILKQKIKDILPPRAFNERSYYIRFSTQLYMVSTGRIDKFGDRFDLSKMSNNWLSFYSGKLSILEGVLSEIIIREKKRHAAMALPFKVTVNPFDHWSSRKDSI